MEAGEIAADADAMAIFSYSAFGNTPSQHVGSPPVAVAVSSSSSNKRKADNRNSLDLNNNTSSPSVSSCYVFKSRLQEYVQKAGLKTPVYETIKEGPSHEPYFKSTVIVNNVRYDSLPGFYNRKAAEQSAAEVALIELAKSSNMESGISVPVHETGLCKNLLQEYAQKMNFAVPLYECFKNEKQGRTSTYSCIVEVGGIKYIGGSANTKKEAEIKAARTALLAIQSVASEDRNENTVYTVIPQKKKVPDLGISIQETAAALEPKKSKFKKQKWKKKRVRFGPKKHRSLQGKAAGGIGSNMDGQDGVTLGFSDAVNTQPNMANGLGDKIDRQSMKEENVDIRGGEVLNVTDAANFKETDSGIAQKTSTADISNSVFHNETREHNLVPFDEGRFIDGQSMSMDVHS